MPPKREIKEKPSKKAITVLFNGISFRQRLRETITHPPEGIVYKTRVPIENMKADHAMARLGNEPKKELFALKMIESLRIPNIRRIPEKFLKGVDLVHTPNQMVLNNIPWIVEVDNSAGLSFYRTRTTYSLTGGFLIKRFLNSKNCKRIICLSEASRKCMENTFKNDGINRKLAVVYPYIKPNPYKWQPSGNGKVRLLFITTNFYAKGGKELVAAFKTLAKKYKNIELTVVTALRLVDPKILNESKKYRNLQFVEAAFSKDELYKNFYSKSDIFIMPTYQDSFGLVYLEALASDLPIIATDMYALPEMVEQGKNGFLIESPVKYFNKDFTPNRALFDDRVDIGKLAQRNFYPGVSNGIVNYASILIEDEKLRKKMRQHSMNLIKTRFSEEVRKKKLREIYEEAVSR